MIEDSSVVFMFKVYNNQFPRHLLCFFERLYDSHNHNTRKKVNNFKIKYSKTSQKASCIGEIGPKLWNNLHSDLQCSKSISRFKTPYKIMLLQIYEHLDYLSLNVYFIVYSLSCMFRHFLYQRLYNYSNAVCLFKIRCYSFCGECSS